MTILIKVAKGKSSSYKKISSLIWFKLMFGFFKVQVELKSNVNNNKLIFKKMILDRFDEVL